MIWLHFIRFFPMVNKFNSLLQWLTGKKHSLSISSSFISRFSGHLLSINYPGKFLTSSMVQEHFPQPWWSIHQTAMELKMSMEQDHHPTVQLYTFNSLQKMHFSQALNSNLPVVDIVFHYSKRKSAAVNLLLLSINPFSWFSQENINRKVNQILPRRVLLVPQLINIISRCLLH